MAKPITAVGTGQTAYVPLTNQIMEVRQIRTNASAEIWQQLPMPFPRWKTRSACWKKVSQPSKCRR